MKFDKSKVYTALNADALKPGDVVFAADSLAGLKRLDPKFVVTIVRIEDETYSCRCSYYEESAMFAYLIAKHDDPYKKFKKAYAEGKEVWFKDWSGEWHVSDSLDFSYPVDHYSLTKPEENWKDFKLGDKVEYNGIWQFVSAIDMNARQSHIRISDIGWIDDIRDLPNVKKLKE